MARFGRRQLCASAAAFLLSACLSPTLPLPPPEAPDDIQQLEMGVYTARGRIPLSGVALIRNLRTGRIYGLITEDEYDFVFFAQPGDPMLIWYEAERRVSSGTSFRVPDDADAGASSVEGGSEAAAADGASDAATDGAAGAAADGTP